MKSNALARANGAPTAQASELRLTGATAGLYALAERADWQKGEVPIFACRLCSITPYEAVVVAPVSGTSGGFAGAHFDGFGIFRATIARTMKSGFVIEFLMDDAERTKLATKLFMMRKQALRPSKETHPEVERRSHERVLPRDPRSTLVFADGAKMPCFVIDMSPTAASASAAVTPPIGSAVALGQVAGRVTRHLDVGFVVQFARVQRKERLDALLTALA